MSEKVELNLTVGTIIVDLNRIPAKADYVKVYMSSAPEDTGLGEVVSDNIIIDFVLPKPKNNMANIYVERDLQITIEPSNVYDITEISQYIPVHEGESHKLEESKNQGPKRLAWRQSKGLKENYFDRRLLDEEEVKITVDKYNLKKSLRKNFKGEIKIKVSSVRYK